MATIAQAQATKITSLPDQAPFGRAAKTAKLAFEAFLKEPYFANLAGMALAKSENHEALAALDG